ncbi:MAG: hypothetical protein IPH08_05085 [Rhodocyclaceae bacterium]|nr:hypothetical protein [Rhodocyclaceae bacterium]
MSDDGFSMPAKGTLERVMIDKMIELDPVGVTFMDFVGTGITEDNIDQIAQNLRYAMYVAEGDECLKVDA